MIETNAKAWNQGASLDVELPDRVRSKDIVVYRSWLPKKRIGLLNERGQLQVVVDIKDAQIVNVTRVLYMTSGNLWVWPGINQ